MTSEENPSIKTMQNLQSQNTTNRTSRALPLPFLSIGIAKALSGSSLGPAPPLTSWRVGSVGTTVDGAIKTELSRTSFKALFSSLLLGLGLRWKS